MLHLVGRIIPVQSSNATQNCTNWLYLLTVFVLSFHLGCAVVGHGPRGESPAPKNNNTPLKAAPPQVISSIHNLPAPSILGVNYVESIGRPGQGAGQFLRPVGLALDHRGQLYVADSGNNRIQVVDIDGNFIAEYGRHGWRTGEFDTPTDVAINFQRTELLYVADTGNSRVQYCNLVDRIFRIVAGSRLNYDLREGEENRVIELDLPEGVGIGRNGEVYTTDTGNHRYIQFNTDGLPAMIRGEFGRAMEQFRDPIDLVVDSRGNVYVVDSGNHRIKKYDFSGNLVQMWGIEGGALGEFRAPSHIALDRWNYLYVTDGGNRRVQVFNRNGHPVMAFTSEELVEPTGIAISRDSRVFVSDIGTNSIQVFQVVYRPVENADREKAESLEK